MKILKKGLDPGLDVAEATCKSCGTVVEVARKECTYLPSFRQNEEYWAVFCPVCSHPIYVYFNQNAK